MATATLQQMVYQVRHYMQGFSQEQQQYTYLTTPIGPTDTALAVADGTQFSRGEIEVGGQELIYLNTVNASSNSGAVIPGGRGWMGSTAASWGSNTLVEDNPVFPYVRVVEAINATIDAVYPDLFVAASKQITKLSVVFGYELAGAEEVISARYNIIGPSHTTPWVRRYRFDNAADTNVFPSGKSIWLGEDVTPGQVITVQYMKLPSELVNPSDDFAGVTGLPASARDAIIWGACERLAPTLEGPRLLIQAAEVAERGQMVPSGSASKISQYFHQLYENRLNEERRKLYDRYERPPHFTS